MTAAERNHARQLVRWYRQIERLERLAQEDGEVPEEVLFVFAAAKEEVKAQLRQRLGVAKLQAAS